VSDELDTGPLGRLALSRGTVDRATVLRTDTAWVEQAWADPRTRVLVVHHSQALVRSRDGHVELVFRSPDQAPEGSDDVVYFGVSGELGEKSPGALDGSVHPAPDGSVHPAPDGSVHPASEDDIHPASLREVGAVLRDRDAGLLTHAVALANWHDTHTYCPRDGAPTVPAPAGHLTTCPVDGTDHFPRLDPAVIMLVLDPDDRCLLARNAMWPERRMSVLAGFVEPGESAEHAVAREVCEETAIMVGQVRYLGSQPWPMPRSLMLGFQAVAGSGQEIVVDKEEIAEARWFSRAELRAAVDAGSVQLAPTSSIARRLIEFWYGEELPDVPGGWAAPVR
jgi:NAD+ diphosphatase